MKIKYFDIVFMTVSFNFTLSIRNTINMLLSLLYPVRLLAIENLN